MLIERSIPEILKYLQDFGYFIGIIDHLDENLFLEFMYGKEALLPQLPFKLYQPSENGMGSDFCAAAFPLLGILAGVTLATPEVKFKVHDVIVKFIDYIVGYEKKRLHY